MFRRPATSPLEPRSFAELSLSADHIDRWKMYPWVPPSLRLGTPLADDAICRHRFVNAPIARCLGLLKRPAMIYLLTAVFLIFISNAAALLIVAGVDITKYVDIMAVCRTLDETAGQCTPTAV
jgi:hypothetical protein